jgi:hypothetical protein
MRRPRVSSLVRSMRAVLPLTALVAVVGCLAWRFWHPRAISEAEAIRLAEGFIVRNGYTELAVPDGTKLDLEPIEFGSNREERLRFRHETLEPKADAAYPMKGGWMVTFRRKERHPDPDARRGVWVDESGKHIHIFHQDVY